MLAVARRIWVDSEIGSEFLLIVATSMERIG